jgi:exosome complex component RRP4
MGKLLIKDKEIAVPGEILAEGMDHLPGAGTYREGNKIISLRLGLTTIDGRAIKLIPLSGRYTPKRGDTIIGYVKDIMINSWILDIDSAYSAMLSARDATSEYIARGADLTQYYTFGDYLVCKITNVTPQKLIDVTMKGPGLRKLKEGRVIKVNTHKVPRIIGKKGSMVSMIKNATGCRIIVGQNGLTWIQSEDPKMEMLAVETIKKIEKEAHISGLTERVKKFLEKATGKKIEIVNKGE